MVKCRGQKWAVEGSPAQCAGVFDWIQTCLGATLRLSGVYDKMAEANDGHVVI